MNDLISRQGAIVAVKDALLAWSYMPKWRDDKIVDAVIGVESATDTNVGTTDTISRQAALNEILGQPPELHYPSWYADQIRKIPPFRSEPNEETISKQDAIEELTEYGNGRTLYISVKEAVRRIKIIPPIKPRKGSWIRTGSGSLYDHYECSECGKAPKWECMGDNRWKIAFTGFCPNCGAKMEVNSESN